MDYLKNDMGRLIKLALKEDIGRRDITTESVIPKDKYIKAAFVAKERCVICGLKLVEYVFKELDQDARLRLRVKDGDIVKKGQVVAYVYGKARCILTGERAALNFLTFLSGVATTTREYIDRIKPCRAKIMDTRKTLPGLRGVEKYAVRCGGGINHRFSLDELVLIKENHLKVASHKSQVTSLKCMVEEVKKKIPKSTKIEIEVENLKEFKDALETKPDIIMLDNMSVSDIRKAVKIRNALPASRSPLPALEASGGINLGNVRQIAATGVDMVSIGALTHSIKSVDMSLEII